MRVLLVDDNDPFVAAVGRFLGAEPGVALVGRARSGPEALAMAKRLRPDVILMDLAMPGMDGLVATRQLKAIPGTPRVIVLTLHDTPDYRAAAAAAGADGFVGKADLATNLMSLLASAGREVAR